LQNKTVCLHDTVGGVISATTKAEDEPILQRLAGRTAVWSAERSYIAFLAFHTSVVPAPQNGSRTIPDWGVSPNWSIRSRRIN
jgi:hypothetical protein